MYGIPVILLRRFAVVDFPAPPRPRITIFFIYKLYDYKWLCITGYFTEKCCFMRINKGRLGEIYYTRGVA